jgi:ferric-dicitrate binding protein FerR (iron transport regulator)
MKNDTHIARLIAADLLGHATEAQASALSRWRAESAANEAIYQHCRAGEDFERAYRVYHSVDWRRPYRRFLRVSGGDRVLRVLRYAAVILLPLAGAGAWAAYHFADTAIIQEQILPGHAHAILTRSTGERFVLDELREEPVVLPAHIHRAPGGEQLLYEETSSAVIVESCMETPRGGEYRLTLSDGTRVHLNARTTLRYPETFPGATREVYLDGEAYFEVAPDAARPFLVITDAAAVRVHGTSFNVNATRPGILRAALVSGSIALTVGGRPGEAFLRPGQLAEYHASADSLAIRDVDLLPHVAWKDNLFVFSGESLGGILDRLADWYDFRVTYTVPRLAAIRYSGILKRYDEISTILEAIEKTTAVTFSIAGREIIVDGPG